VLKGNTKILVHYMHEQHFKDEKIQTFSQRLAKFGTHTLERMFRSDSSLESQVAIPGIKNLGNTCYMNAILQ
jgi:ubiquitin C-terminal hydrolase